ncbi:MAG: hypothetical protein HC869_07360, partial [Rhodospirillales bacterium]|nr:hypothetical protein [Rhodospirillales bacterium]
RILKLFPFSLIELNSEYNKIELEARLEELLIYGLYPEVVLSNEKSKKVEYQRRQQRGQNRQGPAEVSRVLELRQPPCINE